MTQKWGFLDNGDLAVWTHDQEPSVDTPAQTMTGPFSGEGDWNDGDYPDEVEELLRKEWQKGVPDQASGLTAKAAHIQMDIIRSEIQRR